MIQVVAGGVARNKHIRKELESLKKRFNLDVVFPPPKYCTGEFSFHIRTNIDCC